jgi:hypothetical protein
MADVGPGTGDRGCSASPEEGGQILPFALCAETPGKKQDLNLLFTAHMFGRHNPSLITVFKPWI